MGAFLLRRLLAAPAVALLAVALVFTLLHAAGGDPAAALLGEGGNAAELERLRHALGTDRPPPLQFLHWLAALARGELGTSLASGLPVATLLRISLGPTFELALVAFVLSACISLPLLLLETRRGGAEATVGLILAALFSVPVFLWGYLFIDIFALRLDLLPAGGRAPAGSGLLQRLEHLLLPALSLAVVQAALMARLARPALLETGALECITAAHARGETRLQILLHHRLRNASLALLTTAGLSLTTLLGGVVITESIFHLPGLGRLTASAALARDLPVVQGAVLAFAALVIALNLALDLLYALLDPRLRATPARPRTRAQKARTP